MNLPDDFKAHQTKPTKRLAYQIKASDNIRSINRNTYSIILANELIRFKAHETIFPGDFIIALDDDDIYHCREDVFKERYITED